MMTPYLLIIGLCIISFYLKIKLDKLERNYYSVEHYKCLNYVILCARNKMLSEDDKNKLKRELT